MDEEDQGHRILGCSEPPAHRQRPDFRTPRAPYKDQFNTDLLAFLRA